MLYLFLTMLPAILFGAEVQFLPSDAIATIRKRTLPASPLTYVHHKFAARPSLKDTPNRPLNREVECDVFMSVSKQLRAEMCQSKLELIREQLLRGDDKVRKDAQFSVICEESYYLILWFQKLYNIKSTESLKVFYDVGERDGCKFMEQDRLNSTDAETKVYYVRHLYKCAEPNVQIFLGSVTLTDRDLWDIDSLFSQIMSRYRWQFKDFSVQKHQKALCANPPAYSSDTSCRTLMISTMRSVLRITAMHTYYV
ncbi:MAG: hypothetical protein OXC30_00080 [Alphaproteobacteria bacterium]|nr:hypothetical protein [Alphaproteobacteria bacterium]